jgi:putative flippase GtrA
MADSEAGKPVKLTKKQEIIKIFQFVFFELSAGIIQLLVGALLHDVFKLQSWWLTYLPALIASVVWSFTANRKFTFKSISNIPIAMLKVIAYYMVFTPLSIWWGEKLNAIAMPISPTLWYYIIFIGTMLVNFATEFLVYRFWVYRKSINTSETGKKEQEKYSIS